MELAVTDQPLLTAREVAKLLNVHLNTVKRISRDRLPFIRVVERGDRRYLWTDVEAYVVSLR